MCYLQTSLYLLCQITLLFLRISLQAFMCTAKAAQLRAHCASKHDKLDPLTCFPGLPAMDAKESAAEAAAEAEKAAPKPAAPKKKKDADISALLSEGLAPKKK